MAESDGEELSRLRAEAARSGVPEARIRELEELTKRPENLPIQLELRSWPFRERPFWWIAARAKMLFFRRPQLWLSFRLEKRMNERATTSRFWRACFRLSHWWEDRRYAREARRR
jgi:hypothetical protein